MVRDKKDEVKEFGYITVYVEREDMYTGCSLKKPKVKINWKAIGSVDVKGAKKFHKDFAKALKFAESIK